MSLNLKEMFVNLLCEHKIFELHAGLCFGDLYDCPDSPVAFKKSEEHDI